MSSSGREDAGELAAVRDEVTALCSKFAPVPVVIAPGRGRCPGRSIGYVAVIGAAVRWSPSRSMPCVRLPFRVGAVVQPDARRVHKVPTPDPRRRRHRWPGSWSGLRRPWLSGEFQPGVPDHRPAARRGAGRRSRCTAVGQIDDLREVSAPAKTAGIGAGRQHPRHLGRDDPLLPRPVPGAGRLSPDLAPLITVLWVVGMANAVNLIDGLDGLAAGIVAIAAGAFLLYAEQLDNEGSSSRRQHRRR